MGLLAAGVLFLTGCATFISDLNTDRGTPPPVPQYVVRWW